MRRTPLTDKDLLINLISKAVDTFKAHRKLNDFMFYNLAEALRVCGTRKSGFEEIVCLPWIGGLSARRARLLLKHMYDGRGKILSICTHLQACGWPVLFVVIWGHLRFSPHADEEL